MVWYKMVHALDFYYLGSNFISWKYNSKIHFNCFIRLKTNSPFNGKIVQWTLQNWSYFFLCIFRLMKKEWPIWTKTDERIQMRDATDVYRPQPQTWRWGCPWARTSRAWPWWTRTCTCPRRTWGTITNNVQQSASMKFADLSFLWASLFSTCAIGIIITLQRSRKIEFSWFFWGFVNDLRHKLRNTVFFVGNCFSYLTYNRVFKAKYLRFSL